MTIVWLVLIGGAFLAGWLCGASYGFNTALESTRTVAGESELGPEIVSRYKR